MTFTGVIVITPDFPRRRMNAEGFFPIPDNTLYQHPFTLTTRVRVR